MERRILAGGSRGRYGSGWERLPREALVPMEETNGPDTLAPPEYVFADVGCAPTGEG